MNWTDEQEKKLKDLFDTHTTRQLAEIFNVSYSSIYAKCRELGLKRIDYYHWSEEDNNKFIQLYPTTKNKDLAKMFNRSELALRTKAWEMGLKKTDEFMSQINRVPRSSHFKKGFTPWCKGLKLGRDWSREYQFKKGMIPHNKLPEELRDVILEFRRVKRNLNERIKRKNKL